MNTQIIKQVFGIAFLTSMCTARSFTKPSDDVREFVGNIINKTTDQHVIALAKDMLENNGETKQNIDPPIRSLNEHGSDENALKTNINPSSVDEDELDIEKKPDDSTEGDENIENINGQLISEPFDSRDNNRHNNTLIEGRYGKEKTESEEEYTTVNENENEYLTTKLPYVKDNNDNNDLTTDNYTEGRANVTFEKPTVTIHGSTTVSITTTPHITHLLKIPETTNEENIEMPTKSLPDNIDVKRPNTIDHGKITNKKHQDNNHKHSSHMNKDGTGKTKPDKHDNKNKGQKPRKQPKTSTVTHRSVPAGYNNEAISNNKEEKHPSETTLITVHTNTIRPSTISIIQIPTNKHEATKSTQAVVGYEHSKTESAINFHSTREASTIGSTTKETLEINADSVPGIDTQFEQSVENIELNKDTITANPHNCFNVNTKKYTGSALVAATVGGVFIGGFTVFILFYLRAKCRRYLHGDYRPVPKEYDFELNPRFKSR